MSLREHLFKIAGNHDAQLLLALVIYLGEQQEGAPECFPVKGVGASELWSYLDEREPRDVHPSIDHRWTNWTAVTRGLSRLKNQGLVRNGLTDVAGLGPSEWRPTDAAYAYLGERVLFEPSAGDIIRRRRRAA